MSVNRAQTARLAPAAKEASHLQRRSKGIFHCPVRRLYSARRRMPAWAAKIVHAAYSTQALAVRVAMSALTGTSTHYEGYFIGRTVIGLETSFCSPTDTIIHRDCDFSMQSWR